FDGGALTATEKTVGPLAYDFTFFWRVRARGAGGFGPWSAVRRYTTSVPPPALIAPEDGVQGGSAHVFFAWQAMPNAQSYHLQIAEDEDFGRLVFDDAALARPETAAGPLAYGSTFFWRVRARGAGGFGPWSAVRRYTTGVGTAAEPEDGAAPPGYELAPAYPNPFSAEATIRFGLPAAGPVRLAVYDARGRRVAVLAEGVLPAGRYRVRWQPGTLPDGVYLYRLDAGGRTATGRMVLLR
ncbi:MAG: T9SS type A sorting domain-containing protein, partial [Rhodothermales bacterium]|nr:T9SS type A sorting domain-containing protein [Rhodothermales bacterium]